MANIKSQIKRNRQNDKRRLRNRVQRGTSRIAVKNARTAIDSGVPESKAALLEAISALDKAAEKGVIHKNNAARRKSRLMKAFSRMQPAKVIADPATVETAVEPVLSPKGKKTAARGKATKVEPKTETAPEPKKATAKTASKATKAAAKTTSKTTKTPAKKTATPSSPKEKKPVAKKSPKGKKKA